MRKMIKMTMTIQRRREKTFWFKRFHLTQHFAWLSVSLSVCRPHEEYKCELNETVYFDIYIWIKYTYIHSNIKNEELNKIWLKHWCQIIFNIVAFLPQISSSSPISPIIPIITHQPLHHPTHHPHHRQSNHLVYIQLITSLSSLKPHQSVYHDGSIAVPERVSWVYIIPPILFSVQIETMDRL